jgi:polar amino acid transport system substrate-binding protein
MVKNILRAFFAIIFVFPQWGRAEKISFVTTEFPPYVIQENSKLSGFDVELVQELCRRVGAEPEFTVVPWGRALDYVKIGKTDGIMSPVYSEERARYMIFTDQPITHEAVSIMSLHGAGITAASIDDLKDERIGVIFGYSYGKTFDDNSHLTKDVSYDSSVMLKKLTEGRYRLLASDEYVINYVARKSAQPELDTVLTLIDNPRFLGFSKANGQRGKDLAKKFSQAIHDAQLDGTLAKIKKKYFFN